MGIRMETSEVNLVGANCHSIEPDLYGTMSAPGEYYETLHTIAINTRETEFGSYVEPIPITLKAYEHMQTLGTLAHPANGFGFPQSVITPLHNALRVETEKAPVLIQSPVKEDTSKVARPPKKKWIKEYLEEEPELPVSVRVTEVLVSRSNGVVQPPSPVPLAPAAAAAPPAAAPPPPAAALAALAPALAAEPAPAAPPALILDFAQEHSRPRTTNGSHGPTQTPSPPSVGSSGSSGSGGSNSSGGAPRAGTREVHNKLEKNRRAHLKECFELLKRQLPAAPDDKKTSNLSILGSAIRYIQVLRRKERECEHEMERLAREKIASQQRLAALKREVTIRATTVRPRPIDATEEKERDDNIVNEQVLGIPISITSSPPRPASRAETPPPRTLNLGTKLRTLPIQISSTTSQVVRARHAALTLTNLAPTLTAVAPTLTAVAPTLTAVAPTLTTVASAGSPCALQMAGGGVLVGPAALQLLAAGGLRVLRADPAMCVSADGARLPRERGAGGAGGAGTAGGAPPPPLAAAAAVSTVATDAGSVVVSGLAPLVVSQSAARLLHARTHPHALAHKMVEGQMVKGSGAPLAVSAQYLSATTIVKPMVVVTSAHSPAPTT